MKDKDIYEILNELEYDSCEDKEIELDEVALKRIKKNIKKKLPKRKGNVQKVIVAALICLIFMVITPTGQKIIAQITKGLFFSEGYGLLYTDKEIYTLDSKKTIEINGREVIINGILSTNEGVEVNIWCKDDKAFDNLSIKTLNGEIIKSQNRWKASGSDIIQIGAFFKTNELLNEFIITLGEEEVIKISLNKAETVEDYNKIGGNTRDNGVLVGGNRFYFNGDTYFTLWGDGNFNLIGSDFKVYKEDGSLLEVFPSKYSGRGNEFYIKGIYEGKININISKLSIEHKMKNPTTIEIPIAKNGELIEVNKEIYFEEIDEKILLKEVKGTNEGIKVLFDTKTLKKENSEIELIKAKYRSHSAIGTANNSSFEIYFDKEDIKFSEKTFGKISFEVENINILKKGKWNFAIE